MKKILNMFKLKQISELSLWTMISGFSCVGAVFIIAIIFFKESVYISSEIISLGLRMIAQTVIMAAVVDIVCECIPNE